MAYQIKTKADSISENDVRWSWYGKCFQLTGQEGDSMPLLSSVISCDLKLSEESKGGVMSLSYVFFKCQIFKCHGLTFFNALELCSQSAKFFLFFFPSFFPFFFF